MTDHNDNADGAPRPPISPLPEPLRQAMAKAMQDLFSNGTTDRPLLGPGAEENDHD